MIPHFASPRSSHSPLSSSPPPFFKAARDPHSVKLVPYPVKSSRTSAAQKAGIKYEASFHTFMRTLFPQDYTTFERQMFTFSTPSGPRWCRPDAILPWQGRLFLFEVKYRHTSDSWWQLHRLYQPVLTLFYGRPLECVEVCKTFDPGVEYPGPLKRENSMCFLSLSSISSLDAAETLVIDGWNS